jgi:hypothetical protein
MNNFSADLGGGDGAAGHGFAPEIRYRLRMSN